jgi:hypothetical protein
MAGVAGVAAGALGKGIAGLASKIPSVSAGSNLGTGITLGAGATIGKTAVDEAKNVLQDRAFILFLAGLGFFILKILGVQYIGINPTILSILGTFLLIFSGFVFFGNEEKGAWVTILYFYIWGIILGFKGLSPFDPSYLTWVGSIFVIIAIGFMILFKKNGFSENLKEESLGLLPIIIYFLDVGILAQFVDNVAFLNLGGALEKIILWVPWFAYLGIFNIRAKGPLPIIVKTGALVYLFLLITLMVVPAVGFQDSNELFNPEETLAVEQAYREEYQGPNPVLLYVDCFGELMSNIGTDESKTIDECIAEKLLADKLSYICINEWGYTEGTLEYDDCLKKEEVRLEEEDQGTVQGTVDLSFTEHTDAELIINRNTFPSERSVRSGSQSSLNYPISFNVENPRKLTIDVIFSCNFTSKTTGESFLGDITPSSFETIEKSDEVSVICSPPEGEILNGSHTITYDADIYGLETTSYLIRLFIDEDDEETEIVQKAISTYVSGPNTYTSSAPDEFARINFAFGNPETNPVIEVASGGYADPAESNIMLVSSIENVASGRITSINHYEIILEPDLYSSEIDWNCLQGSGYDVILPNQQRRGETVPISVCFLDMYDGLIEDVYLKSFEPKTYTATLNYDYQISESTDVTVTIVDLNN